jgi:hypothetical protein
MTPAERAELARRAYVQALLGVISPRKTSRKGRKRQKRRLRGRHHPDIARTIRYR